MTLLPVWTFTLLCHHRPTNYFNPPSSAGPTLSCNDRLILPPSDQTDVTSE